MYTEAAKLSVSLCECVCPPVCVNKLCKKVWPDIFVGFLNWLNLADTVHGEHPREYMLKFLKFLVFISPHAEQPYHIYISVSNLSHFMVPSIFVSFQRPMNGFMLFAKKFRLELIQQHPGKDNRSACWWCWCWWWFWWPWRPWLPWWP